MYIEECNYMAYALMVVSKVKGGDDPGSFKDAMVMVDTSGLEP